MPWRWHPIDSLSETATIFAIAPAIPSTSAGASDQLSPTISIREKTKSFAADAPVQSSSFAGSGNLRDPANDGRRLRAGIPAPSLEEQTTKQWLKSFGPQKSVAQADARTLGRAPQHLDGPIAPKSWYSSRSSTKSRVARLVRNCSFGSEALVGARRRAPPFAPELRSGERSQGGCSVARERAPAATVVTRLRNSYHSQEISTRVKIKVRFCLPSECLCQTGSVSCNVKKEVYSGAVKSCAHPMA
jgi:hypothetical protein